MQWAWHGVTRGHGIRGRGKGAWHKIQIRCLLCLLDEISHVFTHTIGEGLFGQKHILRKGGEGGVAVTERGRGLR